MCNVTLKKKELFGYVFVLVDHLNEKWFKNLHVFCVSLFY